MNKSIRRNRRSNRVKHNKFGKPKVAKKEANNRKTILNNMPDIHV